MGTTAQEVLTVSLMDVVMAVHVPVEIVQGASVQKAGVGTIAEETYAKLRNAVRFARPALDPINAPAMLVMSWVVTA